MANCHVKFNLGTRECEFSSECLTPLAKESLIKILEDQAALLISEYCAASSIKEKIHPTKIELYFDESHIHSWDKWN